MRSLRPAWDVLLGPACVSADALRPLATTIVGQAALRALDKLRAALPAPLLAALGRGSPVRLVMPDPAPSLREPIVEILTMALRDRRTVDTRYASRASGGPRPHRIDPYVLFLRDGVLFLAGRSHTHREERTFRVDRFDSVQATTHVFDPPSFDLDRYLGSAFSVTRGPLQDVRVRFSARVAELVRSRPVHASQRLAPSPDRGAEVALTVAIGPELVAWILSFADQVR
jgi:predicted DNA-binding transcriptional regulator YafY